MISLSLWLKLRWKIVKDIFKGGDIVMKTEELKCIGLTRDDKYRIDGYILSDGETAKKIKREELANAMDNNKIKVTNVKLNPRVSNVDQCKKYMRKQELLGKVRYKFGYTESTDDVTIEAYIPDDEEYAVIEIPHFITTSVGRSYNSCFYSVTQSLKVINKSQMVDMSHLFYAYRGYSLDLSEFDTSMSHSMDGMFGYCESLGELDLSNFDTSNVETMNGMFQGCYVLGDVKLESFDTRKVTSMGSMFECCNYLEDIDLFSFETDSLLDTVNMFYDCCRLRDIDMSNFNTEKVVDMSGMFAYCKNLNSIDISNFDTRSVASMSNMFFEDESLRKLDLSNFTTHETKDFHRMFQGCKELQELDISNFSTLPMCDVKYMFRECDELKKVKITDEKIQDEYDKKR